MDFCWKICKTHGTPGALNFLWFKKLLVTPQMFWISVFPGGYLTWRERRLPKLRYPTMRMPNSSKCQRWSSQWRGWSPAMFNKNQGMLCFFVLGKVKVVEEEVFLFFLWWSWQFASYITEHRNPYMSRCRYSLRFSNVRNQKKGIHNLVACF